MFAAVVVYGALSFFALYVSCSRDTLGIAENNYPLRENAAVRKSYCGKFPVFLVNLASGKSKATFKGRKKCDVNVFNKL